MHANTQYTYSIVLVHSLVQATGYRGVGAGTLGSPPVSVTLDRVNVLTVTRGGAKLDLTSSAGGASVVTRVFPDVIISAVLATGDVTLSFSVGVLITVAQVR